MFETILLSFIQSATEFLPVSSSGHLILAEKFGLSDQTLATDVALHVGTLVAVLAYFWKDVWGLVRGIWNPGFERSLFVQLIVATIPAVVIGFFLLDFVETAFRSPLIIAFTSIFFGILLWWVDKVSRRNRVLHEMTLQDALMIGLAQCLALVPGTSRSGITITCARWLGLKRVEAARFSMLLSIPTISLGALYVLFQTGQTGTLGALMSHRLLLGMGLSAVFGLIAVWFLMNWIRTASFAIFAVYRVLLGLILFAYFL